MLIIFFVYFNPFTLEFFDDHVCIDLIIELSLNQLLLLNKYILSHSEYGLGFSRRQNNVPVFTLLNHRRML